jgi:hypothetical protein
VAVLFDDTVTGSGIVDFGSEHQVLYALWEVTQIGPAVRPSEQFVSDSLLRAGSVSFAHVGSDFGTSEHYWDAPIYLHHMRGRVNAGWHVLTHDAPRLGAWSFRYDLSPGTEVHFQVVD